MAATAANQDTISLKLMVHKGKNKVIFAEADGNFVNTLFSIMTLPLGTIFRLLEKRPDQFLVSLRSIKNLYQSLMALPVGYFSNEESKFMMLNPRTSAYDCCRKLKLKIDDTEPTKYFVCENEGCSQASVSYFTTCSFTRCFHCRKLMTRGIKYKDICSPLLGYGDDGVFVSNVTSFIVTDDLRVMPNTLDLGLRVLSELGFTDASHVEERTIYIGHEQMLILVKAALLLKYPLTYLVFRGIHPIGTSIQHLIINEKDTNLKTMKLRLTLQKSTSKVLFAEAEEDFVDFLFGFLEIPLGTLIGKLMYGDAYIECLHNLFASISNMSVGGCIRSHYHKNMLIRPQLSWKYVSENQIFPLDVTNYSQINYRCSFRGGTIIRYINGVATSSMRFKDPRVEGRFLKAATKFMVTDDLIVTPLSTISAIGILNRLKVPLKDVEHHEVTIGIEKALKILKASLKSNSTLTDVLLGEIIEKKKREICVENVGMDFWSSSKKHGGPNVDQINNHGLKRKI